MTLLKLFEESTVFPPSFPLGKQPLTEYKEFQLIENKITPLGIHINEDFLSFLHSNEIKMLSAFSIGAFFLYFYLKCIYVYIFLLREAFLYFLVSILTMLTNILGVYCFILENFQNVQPDKSLMICKS
ncbi:hypothetical protein JTB14_031592 [Gonioctena quinquepunctata]|nr:hypothetical protein JTB14_031592 [Gonioctena quinquepunctata]